MRRPVRRLVRGKATIHRIDSEGEEVVKAGIEGLQLEGVMPQKIPIERLEMSQVEYVPVPLGNGAIVKRLGVDDLKKLVGRHPGIGQAGENGLAEEINRFASLSFSTYPFPER